MYPSSIASISGSNLSRNIQTQNLKNITDFTSSIESAFKKVLDTNIKNYNQYLNKITKSTLNADKLLYQKEKELRSSLDDARSKNLNKLFEQEMKNNEALIKKEKQELGINDSSTLRSFWNKHSTFIKQSLSATAIAQGMKSLARAMQELSQTNRDLIANVRNKSNTNYKVDNNTLAEDQKALGKEISRETLAQYENMIGTSLRDKGKILNDNPQLKQELFRALRYGAIDQQTISGIGKLNNSKDAEIVIREILSSVRKGQSVNHLDFDSISKLPGNLQGANRENILKNYIRMQPIQKDLMTSASGLSDFFYSNQGKSMDEFFRSNKDKFEAFNMLGISQSELYKTLQSGNFIDLANLVKNGLQKLSASQMNALIRVEDKNGLNGFLSQVSPDQIDEFVKKFAEVSNTSEENLEEMLKKRLSPSDRMKLKMENYKYQVLDSFVSFLGDDISGAIDATFDLIPEPLEYALSFYGVPKALRLGSKGMSKVKGLGSTGLSKAGGLLGKVPGMSKLGKGLGIGKSAIASGFGKIGGAISKGIAKGFGRIPVLGSLITAGIHYMSGDDLGHSAAAGAGSLAGGIVGGLLGSIVGPAGTMVGGAIGSWLGESLGDLIYDFGSKIVDWISSPKETISNFSEWLGKAWEFIKSPFEWLIDKLGAFFNLIKDGSKWLFGGFDRTKPSSDPANRSFAGRALDWGLGKLKEGYNWMMGNPTEHLSGLTRVSENRTPAILHKDEAVLNSSEADTWRDMMSTGFVNIYRNALKGATFTKKFLQSPSGSSFGSSSGTLNGSNAAAIMNYFTSMGYSPQAAAGIVGNLIAESGGNLDPTALQGGVGPAAGIAQWENYSTKSGRWANLENYATVMGKPWTDLGAQLGFIDQELRGNDPTTLQLLNEKVGGYENFKRISDVAEATRVFMDSFERPGFANASARINSATEVLSSISKYEQGTPYVPDDQLALLHKGEKVIPAQYNTDNPNSGVRSSDDQEVIQLLKDILTALRTNNRRTPGYAMR